MPGTRRNIYNPNMWGHPAETEMVRTGRERNPGPGFQGFGQGGADVYSLYTDGAGNSYVLNNLTGEYEGVIPPDVDMTQVSLNFDANGRWYVMNYKTGTLVVSQTGAIIPAGTYGTIGYGAGGIGDIIKNYGIYIAGAIAAYFVFFKKKR